MAKRFIMNGRASKVSDTNWSESLAAPPKIIKKDSFLDECAGYSEDEFWQDIIHKMSVGKFPKGSSYENGAIYHGDYRFALDIDPENACYEIISFLQTNLGLHSPDEEEVEEVKDVAGNQWTTMLKKHKEQAIIRFMLNEQRRRNLNVMECERLHFMLNIGFTLKYFHKDNVHVNNYTISKIEGLSFDSNTRSYMIDKSQR